MGGVDHACGVFKDGIAATGGGAGAVDAGGDIGSGEIGEFIDEGAAQSGGGNIAPVEEEVGSGSEGGSPAADLGTAGF